MYVQVTLYETGFDSENIFVGNSRAQRDAAIAALPHLELTRCPYNPAYPFRLVGNAVALLEKYDYAIYKYYETEDTSETPIKEWSFFVENIRYINDTVCELIVKRDIIADVLYDTTFQRCQPEQFTYRKDRVNFNYATIDVNNLVNLNEEPLYDTIQFTKNGIPYFWGIGYVVCTRTDFVYIEEGMKYNFGTFLLPFCFDIASGKIINSNDPVTEFYLKYNGVTQQVADIRKYADFISNTSLKGKVVAVDVTFTKMAGVTVSYQNGTRIRINIESLQTTHDLSYSQFNSTAGGYAIAVIERKNNTIYAMPGTINNPLERYPYTYFQIEGNGNEAILDPATVVPSSETAIQLFKSLAPNYVFGIRAKEGQLSTKYHALIEGGNNLFIFDDAFADFMRSNYNSTITGMKVRHQYDWKQFAVDSSFTAAKGQINSVASVATSLLTGGTGAGAAASGAMGQVNDMLNIGNNAANIALNHAKEKELLDLRLKDIQNIPDSISFANSLSIYIQARRYERLFFLTTTSLDTVKNYHKCFGYTSPIGIKGDWIALKSHQDFDYIKTSDVVLTFKNKLPENERALLENYLSNGVRLWYRLDNFKVMSTTNPEV